MFVVAIQSRGCLGWGTGSTSDHTWREKETQRTASHLIESLVLTGLIPSEGFDPDSFSPLGAWNLMSLTCKRHGYDEWQAFIRVHTWGLRETYHHSLKSTFPQLVRANQ